MDCELRIWQLRMFVAMELRFLHFDKFDGVKNFAHGGNPFICSCDRRRSNRGNRSSRENLRQEKHNYQNCSSNNCKPFRFLFLFLFFSLFLFLFLFLFCFLVCFLFVFVFVFIFVFVLFFVCFCFCFLVCFCFVF